MNVLGIAGSLHQESFDTAALRAAAELAPPGMAIVPARISDLPLFNEDLRAHGWPLAVERFRRQAAECEAVLFVSPESNNSVPAPLKNALDWASRSPNPPFADKPAAILGVSAGKIGTVRAQDHLRQVCVFLDLHVLNRPEVMVADARGKFEDGRLVDEDTRRRIAELLAALERWTRRLAAPLAVKVKSGGSGDREVDTAGADSFPASDPPSFTPTKIG